MRAAFSVLELVIAIVILGVFASFAMPSSKHALHQAALTTLAYIRYTQHLALNSSLEFATLKQTSTLTALHPSIDPHKLLDSSKNFWQIQFHQSGIYTLNSFSVFFDTPRFSPTTDRDNQPQPGDIIAINGKNRRCLSGYSNDNIATECRNNSEILVRLYTTDRDNQPQPGDIIAINGKNRRCLSGYSNDNIATECRNNSEILVRLYESFGVESIILESEFACQEINTFRIGFDRFGKPFCARNTRALQAPMQIALKKGAYTKYICILPHSGYAYIAPRGC